MQEVSMAAWRQSILIGLHGGHACIEVRLRRRGAGNVQRVRGAQAECIHLEASASRRHGRMLYPKCVFGLHDSSAFVSMLFGGLRGGR